LATDHTTPKIAFRPSTMRRHSGGVGWLAMFRLPNKPSLVEGLAGGQQIAADRSLRIEAERLVKPDVPARFRRTGVRKLIQEAGLR
jgi:hypothetical protein